MDSAAVLRADSDVSAYARFDVFLCHSIVDAELVQGTKKIIEDLGKSVYVDWIVDPKMNRSYVTARTANALRNRMDRSTSLMYLFSNNSSRSRWMPWELGYFDGKNGNVGILPIADDTGHIDFEKEEYLGLYPKIESFPTFLCVNRTLNETANERADWRTYDNWIEDTDKMRP